MNQSTDTLRLGFVGCGKISEKHFAALEAHKKAGENIQIVAVCDLDAERAAQAAQRFQATPYTDLEAMLQAKSLDLVIIATPNGLHAQQVRQIAAHKVNVVTDKPLAMNRAQGKEVAAFCAAQGVRLFVVHQLRFHDTVQLVKKALDEERFGHLNIMTANMFWCRPQSYYDQAPWHGTKRMDGGAFLTQASHFVDLMQWFAGDMPKRVFASLKTLARRIETEDTGVAVFEWENMLAHINMTVLTYPENYEGTLTILGEKGTVRLGGAGLNKIEHWAFSDIQPKDELVRAQIYSSCSSFAPGHARFYEDIFRAIRQGKEGLISAEEGLKSLAWIDAIYASHEAQGFVDLLPCDIKQKKRA